MGRDSDAGSRHSHAEGNMSSVSASPSPFGINKLMYFCRHDVGLEWEPSHDEPNCLKEDLVIIQESLSKIFNSRTRFHLNPDATLFFDCNALFIECHHFLGPNKLLSWNTSVVIPTTSLTEPICCCSFIWWWSWKVFRGLIHEELVIIIIGFNFVFKVRYVNSNRMRGSLKNFDFLIKVQQHFQEQTRAIRHKNKKLRLEPAIVFKEMISIFSHRNSQKSLLTVSIRQREYVAFSICFAQLHTVKRNFIINSRLYKKKVCFWQIQIFSSRFGKSNDWELVSGLNLVFPWFHKAAHATCWYHQLLFFVGIVTDFEIH